MNAEVALGDLMFVGCGVLWASFTVSSKYWGIKAWVATAMVSVVSGMVCLPLYVIDHAVLVYSFVTVFYFVAGRFSRHTRGYFCFVQLFKKRFSLLGAAKGAVFAALVPPFALCLGLIILNEVVTWVEVTGIACVVLGMLFALGLIQLPYKKRLSVGV